MERSPIPTAAREWFFDQLRAWRSSGILAEEQTGRILDLYETSAEAASRRRSWATFAISSLAALMVGLAVLLVVSYNWQGMTAAAKLTIIFGTLLGSFAVGCRLRLHTPWRLSAEIVLFLSAIFYGASIWLIAQVFHIQSHYPDGIWFWALGTLPLVLCLDSLLFHALYAGLLAIWVGTEILGFHGVHHGVPHFGGIAWPNSAYTLPLLVLPGLILAYRRQSVATVGIYAPLLAWWAVLQPVAWECEVNPIYFIGLAGALMLWAAEMHRDNSRLAAPYWFYGILITGGILIPLSYADFIIELLRYRQVYDNYVSALVICLLGAGAMLAAVLLQQRSPERRSLPFADILRRQWLPVALILLLAGLCVWTGVFGHETGGSYSYDYAGHRMLKWTPPVFLPMAVVNATMIVLALWLMRLGLRKDHTAVFSTGVLYFLLWAVLRYFDLFGGVGGMLGAAVLFLLCGVGLFLVARFWLHRKETSASPITGRGAEGECSGAIQMEDAIPSLPPLTLTLPPTDSTLTGLPGWLERMVAAAVNRIRTLLAVAIIFQLSVLLGMIFFKAGPLWTGENILLRVVPVDPRDLFRGDYVTLSYDFSRIPPGGIPELGKPIGSERRRQWEGQTVYISLAPEEDGEHYRMAGIHTQPPAEGLFIRGTIVGYDRIQCGIESYYVQEGQGRKYEDAARNRRLSAKVALAADGRATLRGLVFEPAPPPVRPAYDRDDKYRWPREVAYRARCLPHAEMNIDGRLDEPQWRRANAERNFLFPWETIDAPPTEFLAFCDDEHLYFAFRVEDHDIVIADQISDKQDVVFEDRVELFFSRDPQMKDYFCLEIDPRGRVNDYQASYYRQFDSQWQFEGIETAGTTIENGYVVEGRISLATLVAMGFPQLTSGTKVLCGLYRAEFSRDHGQGPAEPQDSIHTRGRQPPPGIVGDNGRLPIQKWISWIDPETPEPDFHVPSSLGHLEIIR